MLDYFTYPYGRPEQLAGDYVIATYLVYGADYATILKKAGGFAVGQTVGTWIKVPGISGDMIERYQGRILSVSPVPTKEGGEPVFVIRLAFPQANFDGSFTMLLTALAGNDVSTALHTKLMDLEFCGNPGPFPGPRKGIKELRELTGAYNRPVVLNMIKPCLGFTPEEGAKLFFEVAKGGVDVVKDDELLGSPEYSLVERRVRAYGAAAERAYEITGKRTVYMPNISGTPARMLENAKAAVEAGAKACLVNFVFGGPDALAQICDAFGDKLFIMAHYAGVGVLNWKQGGIANNVFIGILPRMAGAHAVMTMCPPRDNPEAMYDFYRTVQAQKLPMGGMGPIVTAVGGGVTPGNQLEIQRDLGVDMIIGIGGAIQGHPMGTAAGAQAAMAAVAASARGIPLEDAARDCESLQAALRFWN